MYQPLGQSRYLYREDFLAPLVQFRALWHERMRVYRPCQHQFLAVDQLRRHYHRSLGAQCDRQAANVVLTRRSERRYSTSTSLTTNCSSSAKRSLAASNLPFS